GAVNPPRVRRYSTGSAERPETPGNGHLREAQGAPRFPYCTFGCPLKPSEDLLRVVLRLQFLRRQSRFPKVDGEDDEISNPIRIFLANLGDGRLFDFLRYHSDSGSKCESGYPIGHNHAASGIQNCKIFLAAGGGWGEVDRLE